MSAVRDSITITTPELPGGVTFLEWREVANRRYLKVSKCDSKIVRLLTNHGNGTERALAGTSIIEDLLKLRNNRRQKLLEANRESEEAAAGKPADDLGLDEMPMSKRPRAALQAALPDAVDVQTPQIESVQSISMSVLLPATTALWMEMTGENIDYLRAVVKIQMSEGSIHRSRCREQGVDSAVVAPSAPSTHVVWAWDRGSFRARVKSDDGRVKHKDFRPESTAAPAIEEAGEAAARYVAAATNP